MLVIQNVLGDYTAIKAQDVQITDTLNSFQTLSFSFIATPENEVAAKMMIPLTVIEVPENGQKYRLLTASTAKAGKYLQYSVTAVHIAKDMRRYYRESRLPQTQSLRACLDFMFKDTPFSYVIEGDFPNFYFSEGFGENFVDELLTQCASDFKFEYYFDNYTLHIARQIGADNAFVFIDNVNCAKIAVSENYENIATHIVGYSNPKQNDSETSTETTYEQKIDYTSPIAESANWPVIDATPVKYDQTLDYNTLLARMKSSLQDYPQVQYSIDSVNFKRFSKIKNKIAIGNQGWLRDRFGIDVKTRISSLTWFPQDASKTDTITFGNTMLDPVTWSVRNRKAFQQNVVLGKKMQSEIARQQKLYDEAMKAQDLMAKNLKAQTETIGRLQNQLDTIKSEDNYWVSGRLFVDLSKNTGDQNLNWYATLNAQGIRGAMLNLTIGNADINSYFNSQRANVIKSDLKFIGVYHQLKAKNTAEATTEAAYFLKQIRNYDLPKNIVVSCKLGDQNLSADRATLTANVVAFNKVLADGGYTNTCDYAPLNWFTDRFYSSSKYKWIVSISDTKPSTADAWYFTQSFAGYQLGCSRSYNKIFV
ncbi:MAG TPA: hypothetical protein DCR08_06310 [Lactobacillus sp.]|uniref:phage tail protein n=1 Tax=Ligilactobacillus murinus TaxID=1622 RepID=UPI00096E79F1|nr:phage tail protein [Ligilactobacillus murinus]ASD50636.1 hypothetical protein [Lactobacillus phage phiEF-1.1]HAP23564.1 hypothetical protein [Lactobacillus sp.]